MDSVLALLELELLEGGESPPRIITPLTMVILLRPELPAEDISAVPCLTNSLSNFIASKQKYALPLNCSLQREMANVFK